MWRVARVLENEVTELKSRLAEAERRASVLPAAVSTTEEQAAAGGKRASLLPAPILPVAAQGEGAGVPCISEALLRSTLAEKYEALAPGVPAMPPIDAAGAARAKGVSLGGLEPSKPPASSAAAAGPRRRVTVGSCEP